MCNQRLRFLVLCVFVLLGVAGCSRGESEQKAQNYLERSEAYIAQGQYRAAMIEASNAMASSPENIAYRVAMADIYNTLGAGARASELLEGAAEHHPNEVSLTLAKAYLLQGKFLSAREVLDQFEPQTEADARQKSVYLADSARIQGELGVARDAYQALLEQYPGDREIQKQLAENYVFMGEADKAQTLVDELLSAQPTDIKALHLDAALALQRNDRERAERRLSKALVEIPRTDIMLPERAAVLQLLVETLIALGRSTEALIYQKVLADGAPESLEAQRRLRDALAALEKGNFDEAERLLEDLLQDNPNSRSAAVMLGVVRLNKGDVEAAESLLSRHVDVETANTDIIQATVLAQAEAGKSELALETLERALQARPNDPVLRSIYGLLALSLPEHQREGYLSLQKALAQEPQRGRLRLALARYHTERAEPEQALAQLKTAFSHQPTDWSVTNVYINQLFAAGKLDEVARVVSELEKAAPSAPETQLFESQYLFRSGDQATGIQRLRRLLQSEPEFARGHGVLAQMYTETERPAEALAALERLLALEPENERALRAGLELVTEQSLGQTPEQWLISIAEKIPEATGNTLGLRAMALRSDGDLAAAQALLNRYAGEDSDYLRQTRALIARDLAQAEATSGEFDAAREYLMQALTLFPNSLSLNVDLVHLELNAGRERAARLLLDDLEARHQNEPRLIVLQAQLIARDKGVGPAYERLKAAWDKQPHSQMAPLLVSWADQRDPAAVPGLLKQWQTLDPRGRERLLYMAERSQRQGDTEAAEEYYELVLAQNEDDVIALNNLAWILKERNPSRASGLAQRAVSLQPASAPILDTYGWILHLQGEHQRALEHLERAVQLAPEAAAIKANLNAVREAL
ncbi:tetratricopeptide repeat protein [Marinimicrobium sp. ABcell2]|uniref:tetratricopeptide repeat protein n=1 Tax=Marinimicrobium sp. ABcell2 TaxID=3069751 RepID=UPI0027B35214|nr:tetratricopeptide repeat protein [Marinimicrobium sp. ABcell2]MDQ2076188.1 tetratricopeptide repeat protein [Marinimicrobium sp. ABcell2]